jgi:protein-tyrosine phosphatase
LTWKALLGLGFSEALLRVLFVCTGNICRSPLAEAIFAHYVREEKLTKSFSADSAGIGAWHTGEPADPRTCEIGARYGVDVPSIARQFERQDYERFDLILAMDHSHFSALSSKAPDAHRHKLRLMRDYDRPENRGTDVPDPYYGGPEGFESMYQMLALCCRNLLESLKTERAASSARFRREP